MKNFTVLTVAVTVFFSVFNGVAYAADCEHDLTSLTRLEKLNSEEIFLRFNSRYNTPEAAKWDEMYGPYVANEVARVGRALSKSKTFGLTLSIFRSQFESFSGWFAKQNIDTAILSKAESSPQPNDALEVRLWGPTRSVVEAALAIEPTYPNAPFFSLQSREEFLNAFQERFPAIQIRASHSLDRVALDLATYVVNNVSGEKVPFEFEVWSSHGVSVDALKTDLFRAKNEMHLDVEILDAKGDTYFYGLPPSSAKLSVLLVQGNARDLLRLSSNMPNNAIGLHSKSPLWTSFWHRLGKTFRRQK